MNRRMISVLVFALLVSGGASAALYRMITSRMPSQTAAPSNKLLVAARILEPGTLLKDGDISEMDWPGPIPAGVINLRADIVGRGVVSTIYEKEAIVETRLGAKGAGAGFAAGIPDGMRAVAIRVNDIVSVAGFVVPGARVDILVTGTGPNSTDGTKVKTILQNMEVLSAGQNFQRDQEGKPVSVQVVNVLVTPAQAEVLSLASTETKIQLVLRNPIDRKMTVTKGAAIGELFGDVKKTVRTRTIAEAMAAVPPPLSPAAPTVEMINGTKRIQASFPGGRP